jgi:hypothetical protein
MYMKWHYQPSESGKQVHARLYAGSDRDSATYSGTLVLSSVTFEQMLDSMIFGAASMNFPDGKLTVQFAQEQA